MDAVQSPRMRTPAAGKRGQRLDLLGSETTQNRAAGDLGRGLLDGEAEGPSGFVGEKPCRIAPASHRLVHLRKCITNIEPIVRRDDLERTTEACATVPAQGVRRMISNGTQIRRI